MNQHLTIHVNKFTMVRDTIGAEVATMKQNFEGCKVDKNETMWYIYKLVKMMSSSTEKVNEILKQEKLIPDKERVRYVKGGVKVKQRGQ